CGAMKALLARRIEETKVWRDAGHRSAAHWVAETTGETVGAACRTLETARALDALPDTDAAFRAGRLSPTQAAEITSAAGTDPTAETELLDAAGSTSVKGLRDRCRVRWGARRRRPVQARRGARDRRQRCTRPRAHRARRTLRHRPGRAGTLVDGPGAARRRLGRGPGA